MPTPSPQLPTQGRPTPAQQSGQENANAAPASLQAQLTSLRDRVRPHVKEHQAALITVVLCLGAAALWATVTSMVMMAVIVAIVIFFEHKKLFVGPTSTAVKASVATYLTAMGLVLVAHGGSVWWLCVPAITAVAAFHWYRQRRKLILLAAALEWFEQQAENETPAD